MNEQELTFARSMMLSTPFPFSVTSSGSFISRTKILMVLVHVKIPSCLAYACESNSVIPYSECTSCSCHCCLSIACTSLRVISSLLPFMPPVSITIVLVRCIGYAAAKSSRAKVTPSNNTFCF